MDAVELTRALVAIESINPGGSEHACARYLGDLLAGEGFQVRYHEFAPGRTSVVASRGGRPGSRHLCFAGHIDTVPLGNAGWSVDPFGGEIHDGKLYGRGVTDMKSGIASFVCAAVELGEALDDGPGLLLIMAAGEETGCEGSRPLGEELAKEFQVGAMVIAEPTYNLPKVGHRGAFWLRMTATGKTAHGSMPELGINALYKAARAVIEARGLRLQHRAAPAPRRQLAQRRQHAGGSERELGAGPRRHGGGRAHDPRRRPRAGAPRPWCSTWATTSSASSPSWIWTACGPIRRIPGCSACSTSPRRTSVSARRWRRCRSSPTRRC